MKNKVDKFSTRVKAKYKEDTVSRLNEMLEKMEGEGYSVEFGSIGNKTTYCLLSKGDEEIVGYTFIKNIEYKVEDVGRLKALHQAITRKESYESSLIK